MAGDDVHGEIEVDVLLLARLLVPGGCRRGGRRGRQRLQERARVEDVAAHVHLVDAADTLELSTGVIALRKLQGGDVGLLEVAVGAEACRAPHLHGAAVDDQVADVGRAALVEDEGHASGATGRLAPSG